ncbi:MAG: protein kinase [Coriobacteriaceae bacterium]|jgi:serine/threonine protein kinase|nr:protein kinase [Coriobacteriaceae bacterium]
MNNEIIGNSYKYVIDTSYGINKDGFIAIGSESVVYKGLKTKQDGGLQFSCVLKFKPKSTLENGIVVNRLDLFRTEELKIFEELRECRSVVRIDDVIEDLGSFSLACDKVNGGVINGSSYFCVVEEFIDGWNLDEYCREEYWKLRRIEPLSNGLSNVVDYQDFSPEEKAAIDASYSYENVLKYQNQIMLFMINLCEIMQLVTEQKDILHLDIKPENIMVTRYGKELVLIDFGRSKKTTKANRHFDRSPSAVDYGVNETIDAMYQYGTLGYAAPECYAKASAGSDFPFSLFPGQGRISVESDIFSFGATFWECLNIFELATKSRRFVHDPHDFYRDRFLCDAAYVNRDLSCTSPHYHKKLEAVIRKCTRKRNDRYTDPENKDFYHSYYELRKEIEDAKDSAPTIKKEEDVKVKNAFSACGSMLALLAVFLMVFAAYYLMAFNIAQGKWDALTANYNDTQFYRLEGIAQELVATAPGGQVDDTYARIAGFTYRNGGDISEYEAPMLIGLLQHIDRPALLPERVDEIMRHADTRKFKEIATEVVKLEGAEGSIGYDLALAIFNVEVGKTGMAEAYETLTVYLDNPDFRSAVVKLKNVLDTDANIKAIADATGSSKLEIQEVLKNAGTKGA